MLLLWQGAVYGSHSRECSVKFYYFLRATLSNHGMEIPVIRSRKPAKERASQSAFARYTTTVKITAETSAIIEPLPVSSSAEK